MLNDCESRLEHHGATWSYLEHSDRGEVRRGRVPITSTVDTRGMHSASSNSLPEMGNGKPVGVVIGVGGAVSLEDTAGRVRGERY